MPRTPKTSPVGSAGAHTVEAGAGDRREHEEHQLWWEDELFQSCVETWGWVVSLQRTASHFFYSIVIPLTSY